MIYEFQCRQCSTIFEIKATLAEKEKGLKPRCPRCNSDNTH
ncbi:MAG: FmdB family zinc ribbon protein [bacterium]